MSADTNMYMHGLIVKLKVPSDGARNLESSAGEIKIQLDHVVVSDLIGHCVDHAHYPSTVPNVIASAADLLALAQPQRMRRTAQRVG